MSKPLARLATRRPIRPRPQIPRVLWWMSRPRNCIRPHPFHFPDRKYLLASTRPRLAARIRHHVRSAVGSSSTPGVLVIITPRSVAAFTSRLLNPTATFETIFKSGHLARTVSEIVSVSIVIAPCFPFSLRMSWCGVSGTSRWLVSTSQCRARYAIDSSNILRVIRTFGLSGLLLRHHAAKRGCAPQARLNLAIPLWGCQASFPGTWPAVRFGVGRCEERLDGELSGGSGPAEVSAHD